MILPYTLVIRIKNSLFFNVRRTISKLFENKIKIEVDQPLDIKLNEEVFSYEGEYYNLNGEIPYWFKFKNITLRDIGWRVFKNCEVISGGIILNPCGEVIIESTIFQKEYLNKLNNNHLVYFRRFIPYRRINRAIVLSNYLGKQYYHWNMESLSRLLIIDNIHLKEYKIIIDKNAPKFVRESLILFFKIDQNNIIELRSKKIKIKEVIIPSFPFTRNAFTKMTFIYSPSIIIKMNELSKTITQINKNKKNIIISRERATQRRIKNVEFLMRTLPSLKFEVVVLEDFSFKQQLEIFRNANIILSTHGAGLVNLLYAENPKIIEFFPAERTKRDAFYFFQITSKLRFYHCLIEYLSVNDEQDLFVEIEHINQINKFLNALNSQKN